MHGLARLDHQSSGERGRTEWQWPKQRLRLRHCAVGQCRVAKQGRCKGALGRQQATTARIVGVLQQFIGTMQRSVRFLTSPDTGAKQTEIAQELTFTHLIRVRPRRLDGLVVMRACSLRHGQGLEHDGQVAQAGGL